MAPKKRARAAAADWRAPLFAWRGALAFDAEARVLSWRGAWVSVEPGAGAPDAAAFAESENSFECAASAGNDAAAGGGGGSGLAPALALALAAAAAAAAVPEAREAAASAEAALSPAPTVAEAAAVAEAAPLALAAGGALSACVPAPASAAAASAPASTSSSSPAAAPLALLHALAGASVALRSSYLLDQGDGRGRQRFADEVHCLAFGEALADAQGAASAAVAAVGATEFGRFVSFGRAKASSGGALTLTLARRYIDDADPRAALAANDARGALAKCEELLAGGAGQVAAGAAAAAAATAAWDVEAALPWRLDKKLQRVNPK